jgi:type I restriction enzyme S subunit
VTPKTFLANFRHVVNAPLGVSRLREMVYALAVSGSLCPQRPDDGTGHQLLEQINAEKESRIQRGVFKRSPKLEGATANYSDTLPRIPGSWAWSRLVDLGEINPRNDADDDTLAAFAPMNAISELHNGPVRSEDRNWGSIKKGFTHFADGDVMVAKITPCFENGKGAVLRGLTNGIGAGTTELHVVRPLPGVLPAYIYVFLRSPHFKMVGESHMTGTAGQKRLSTEYFALREFPLPPLEEQKRIVAKVDELMRLCDRLEAQQQEREKLLPLLSRANHTRFVTEPTAANLNALFQDKGSGDLDHLRNTILALAVSGRFAAIEEERSAHEVLDEIARKRQQTFRPSEPPATLRDSYALPSTWCWARFEDVAVIASNLVHPKDYLDLPHLAPDNVEKATGVLLPCRTVREDKVTSANHRFFSGQIVYSKIRPNLSKVVLVDFDGLCSADMYPISPLIDPGYLHLFMLSEQFLSQAVRSDTRVAMPKINRKELNAVVVPVAPVNEQRHIVATVSRLAQVLWTLREQRKTCRKVAESFAIAAVAQITSTEFTENERMIPPKTEVVTALKVGKKPKKPDAAPLATLLSEQKAEGSAKTLWQLSGLEIDAFYRQLNTEMTNGWIEESHRAFVREKFEIWPKINELKGRLGWEEVGGTARAWWDSFERENRHRPEFLLRLLERLVLKRLTIESFFENNAIQITDVRTVTEALPYVDEAAIESLFTEEAESKS